jgi:allantoinase
VDVSVETCPHYLFFTEQDVERLGAIAKCAPPLRDAGCQEALWAAVMDGSVDVIASDHSPAPRELKTGEFWRAWGGIQGVQSTLAVMLDRGFHDRRLPLERIAALLAGHPSQRFRIPNKGSLHRGNDADLALVDLSAACTLRPEDLHQRHALSPYIEASFRGTVRRTIRRGETIFQNGAITVQRGAKFLRPRRAKDTHA